MNRNENLTRIFSEAGAVHGYDDVKADFTPFRDFKVKWMRSYKWINFDVSDYMMEADERILSSVADTLYRKIRNLDGSYYSKEVCDWLTSDGFVEMNQDKYVRRCRGFSLSPKGRNHDLSESYARLVDQGLVEEDPMIRLGWLPSCRSRSVGHSSVLMKVVSIYDNLDASSISDDLMDYCLFSQLCHVGMGFNRTGTQRNAEYDAALNMHPNRDAMEEELMRLCLSVG